jgi:ribosomal protein L14|tara:strand:+ start:579 stop:812 length:234 start_codon:yes stop_codon:yes gene_type:complete
MLKLKSKVIIGDNSGATKGEVIKILKPKNAKTGVLGSLLLVAVKRNIANSKIRKGSMSKAYYIRTNIKSKSYSSNLK